MSKKYSGRIHDPNHERHEYDIYFNDTLISETVGNLRTIRSTNVRKISDYSIEITFGEPIPNDYIIFSTYALTITASETNYGTIIGQYNSVDNTALRYGANNFNLTTAGINEPEFNDDRTKMTLTSGTYKFIASAPYAFIAVTAS